MEFPANYPNGKPVAVHCDALDWLADADRQLFIATVRADVEGGLLNLLHKHRETARHEAADFARWSTVTESGHGLNSVWQVFHHRESEELSLWAEKGDGTLKIAHYRCGLRLMLREDVARMERAMHPEYDRIKLIGHRRDDAYFALTGRTAPVIPYLISPEEVLSLYGPLGPVEGVK